MPSHATTSVTYGGHAPDDNNRNHHHHHHHHHNSNSGDEIEVDRRERQEERVAELRGETNNNDNDNDDGKDGIAERDTMEGENANTDDNTAGGIATLHRNRHDNDESRIREEVEEEEDSAMDNESAHVHHHDGNVQSGGHLHPPHLDDVREENVIMSPSLQKMANTSSSLSLSSPSELDSGSDLFLTKEEENESAMQRSMSDPHHENVSENEQRNGAEVNSHLTIEKSDQLLSLVPRLPLQGMGEEPVSSSSLSSLRSTDREDESQRPSTVSASVHFDQDDDMGHEVIELNDYTAESVADGEFWHHARREETNGEARVDNQLTNTPEMKQETKGIKEEEDNKAAHEEEKEEEVEEDGNLIIHFNKGHVRGKRWHTPNYIKTTKYTWWNFIFIFLFEQYRKINNIFFLAIMIFSLIPGVSPVSPATSVMPVIFILGVALIREGSEEFMRYRADLKANSRPAYIARDGELIRVKTSSISPGDIIRVKDGEECPADMLLLSTSLSNGYCYIETSNLDGESNLKLRKSVTGTVAYDTEEKLTGLSGGIECEKPNMKLYRFRGTLTLHKSPRAEEKPQKQEIGDDNQHSSALPTSNVTKRHSSKRLSKRGEVVQVPLDHNHLLLKGSVVRNTRFAFGIAVYTGKNTKLFKNLKQKSTKFSYLDNSLNQLLLSLLTVHQILVVIFIILAYLFQQTVILQSFYIPYESEDVVLYVVKTYLTGFILFNLFIPMSLFVSLEFVKSIQTKFMSWDNKMRDKNGRGMKPNTSNLNADLSRIEIIFSDKTGTLTENKMVFKKCSLRTGRMHDESVQPTGLLHTLIQSSEQEQQEQQPLNDNVLNSHPLANGDNDDDDDNNIQEKEDADRYWIRELMFCLSLCNTIMPHVDPATGQVKFDGESPDEIALLQAMAGNGCRLVNRDDQTMELDIVDETKKFKIIAMLPFDSDRKRMSIIVQEILPLSEKTDLDDSDSSSSESETTTASQSKIYCYSKGADSSLLPVINENDVDAGVDKMLSNKIDGFAREGLRTLVLCRREIDPDYCKDWVKRLKTVQLSMGTNRDKQLQVLYDEIEDDFELIGISAIEDKLQKKVPETISFFREAGVQMWMLTGDKRETAVNIARTAKLVDEEDSVIHTINAETLKECSKQLATALWRILSPKIDLEQEQNVADMYDMSTTTSATEYINNTNNIEYEQETNIDDPRKKKRKKNHVLVIDGNSLAFIFGNHPRLHRRYRGKQLVNKAVAAGVEAGHRVRRQSAHVAQNLRSRASRMHDSDTVSVDPGYDIRREEELKRNMKIRQRQCFEAFVKAIQFCPTVICCRATPLQKALLVRLMKRRFNKIGLAIGDGANDVSMIQEARVGIGIMGVEGSQAARAADYSIHRFHHLRRLLAVHGRYSIVRTGLFIQYSFYKNMVITFLQVLFSAFNLFSGQSVLESWFLTFYNLLFTLLTPFVMGLLERDVSEDVLMNNPIIYKQTKSEDILNWKSFARWSAQGFYHSCVIFFFLILTDWTSGGILTANGWTNGVWTVATAASFCVNLIVNLKSILVMNSFTLLHSLSIVFSVVSIYIFQALYSLFVVLPGDETGYMYYVTFVLLASPKFHLLMMLIVVACLAPDIVLQYIRRFFFPKTWELLQERRVFDNRRRKMKKLAQRAKSAAKEQVQQREWELQKQESVKRDQQEESQERSELTQDTDPTAQLVHSESHQMFPPSTLLNTPIDNMV